MSGWYYHPLLEPIEKVLDQPLLVYKLELDGRESYFVDTMMKTLAELRRKLKTRKWKQLLKKWNGKNTPIPSFGTMRDLFGWLYEVLLKKQLSPESISLLLEAAPPVEMDWREKLDRWSIFDPPAQKEGG